MLHTSLIDSWNAASDAEEEVEMVGRLLAREDDLLFSNDEVVAWSSVSGLASAVEKIYTGYERIMTGIARDIDGVPIPASGEWHKSLILRMKNAFADVRPAFLSAELSVIFDKLRGFRSRERNLYGGWLDVPLVVENAKAASRIPQLFKLDLMRLSAALNGEDREFDLNDLEQFEVDHGAGHSR